MSIAMALGLFGLLGPTAYTLVTRNSKAQEARNGPFCGSYDAPRKNEFVLFLDKNAYVRFDQPTGLKKISIWKLDFVANVWSELQEQDLGDALYKDKYIELTKGLKLKLLSTDKDVFELRKLKASEVLCTSPTHESSIYVKLVLAKKQLLHTKAVEFHDDTFILCDNEYILAINVPVHQWSVTETNPELLSSNQFYNNTNANLLYRFNNLQSPTLTQNSSKLS